MSFFVFFLFIKKSKVLCTINWPIVISPNLHMSDYCHGIQDILEITR